MIKIFPDIEYSELSPYGNGTLIPKKILWQGVHTCVETECSRTKKTIIADLPIGHAVMNLCKVNVESGEIFCPPESLNWLGKPLLQSLRNPMPDMIPLTVEKIKESNSVVIVNCIDHLYGHALLKLFNTERHLNANDGNGVIVIVQDFLRWLVPEGVAEIWTVKIPLSKAQNYFPLLNEQIVKECGRFSNVFVSNAYSHPNVKDIVRFSRIPIHDDSSKNYRITFIWRGDRPWTNNPYIILAAKKMGFMNVLLGLQNKKIHRLFSMLKKQLPNARFTVAGFGRQTQFPDWVDDRRVIEFSDTIERELCQVYAESRVVLGVHGSNMLLPSAHAGMTVDLMPKERWGNFAQDVIFQENDPRIGSFRYRFFPISTPASILAHLIATQIVEFEYFKKQMSH